MYEDLKSQIKFVEEQLGEKIRGNKKLIGDLEESSEKKYTQKLQQDEKNKIANEKMQDFQQRLKELEKKTDIALLLERQSNRMKNLEEKLYDLNQDLQHKFEEIMLKEEQDEYRKKQEEYIHKLCDLEGYIKNLHADMNKYKNMVLDLQTENEFKISQIEKELASNPFGTNSKSDGQKPKLTLEDIATQRDLIGQMDLIRVELGEKFQDMIDRVYSDMKRMNEDEKTLKLFNLMNDLQKRSEMFEEKLARTSREMDMHSLLKQLRDKAENDVMKRDFAV